MTNTKYRLDEVYKNRTAIFAPDDICAIAVVDSYIGSREKAEAIVAKANLCDELLGLVERAKDIRNPNLKWTKAETERSWLQWEKEVQAAIAEATSQQEKRP